MEDTEIPPFLRGLALIAILAGAVGSLSFMFYAGRRNPSVVLMILFTGWVLAPFAALGIAHSISKRWPVHARIKLHRLTLVVAAASLAVYAVDVWTRLSPKAAFVFLVVPLLSLLLIGATAIYARTERDRRSYEGQRLTPPLTFSGTRIAGWYFIVQGLAILAWWLFLAGFPFARELFVPPGASEIELLAFRLPDLLVAVPASLAAAVAILAGMRWVVPLAWLVAGAVNYAFVYCAAWSLLRHGGWLNVIMMAPLALLSTISAIDASAATIVIFRRAKPASSARHVLATLAQITVFWSFFLFVVPAAVVYVERQLPLPGFAFPAQRAAALLLFAGFSSLGLASGMTMAARGSGTPLPFAAPNRLVTSGPYAHVRNPMVIAGLGQGAAVGIWLGSWAVLGYVLLGGMIWHFLVRPAEERNLRDVFGNDFIAYCSRVRCWLPRLRPFVRTR